MKVRFCGLSMWQMDLSSAQIPSFFFLKQKRHPCKFLSELQALMSLPEKEGFELSTSSAKPAGDYAVPPLQNCNKGRSDSGFAVFSMGKEISFLFFASSPSLLLPPAAVGGRSHTARRSGSMLFLLKQKKTSLQIPFGIASVDVFTGEGGI